MSTRLPRRERRRVPAQPQGPAPHGADSAPEKVEISRSTELGEHGPVPCLAVLVGPPDSIARCIFQSSLGSA